MMSNDKPKYKDESLEILKAIDNTSEIIQQNTELKKIIDTKSRTIKKLEKKNIILNEENKDVLRFKNQDKQLRKELRLSNQRNEKLQKSKNESIQDNRKLVKEINNLRSTSESYKKDIHAQYKGIRIKSKLIRYVSVVLCFSAFCVFLYFIEKENREKEIADLKNQIEQLSTTSGTVKATVIGIYSDKGLPHLQYKNDEGEIWVVKNYKSVTDQNIKLYDRISVDFIIKNNIVTFKNITLL